MIVSQLELDNVTTQRALVKLLEGLESMRPEILILLGDFVSAKQAERLPFDGIRQHFDTLAQIVKDNDLRCLKEQTQWILAPSLDDPGQSHLLPCVPLSDFFVTGPRSTNANGQKLIKNVTLASNPFRISFYGKEIVIARYNFYKKLKKNHLAKVQLAVERIDMKIGAQEEDATPDSLRVAKTILHQGTLVPLPQIV